MMNFMKHLKKNNPSQNDKQLLFKNYDQNLNYIKELFNYPVNSDFKLREILIKATGKRAAIFFIDVMSNTNDIENHILQPLLEDGWNKESDTEENIKCLIKLKSILKKNEFTEIATDVITGNTIILLEDESYAFSAETTSYASRTIDKPIREDVIRGPQEGFVESGQLNRSLVRKRLRDPNLITEVMLVGKRSKNPVSILYVKGIINPEIVDEIKKKIKEIDADIVQSIEILEQYIEPHPYSIIPAVLYTERPDRAVSFLMEGHVIVMMDCSSSCLVLPVTFWALFQSPEDTYQKWVYGNFLRIIRFVAFFFSISIPGFFLAIVTFHSEMIPTDLLIAIAGGRESVPFPLIIEILLMELSFELLREAGIRIPSAIGPTIGIVGGIIIGEAAVQANLVSPILVVIVSLTGLSSFAIQDNSLNYMVRIIKFVFILLGGIMGIVGIAMGFIITVNYFVTIESYGIPFLSPFSPYYQSSRDTFFRPQVWKQKFRPTYLNQRDKVRR